MGAAKYPAKSTKTMHEPAHLKFIEKCLDWERVETRLRRYEHIAKFFPLLDLRRCIDKAPYYCHYLGWRLGTWQDENWFDFFERLLEAGSNLPGWNKRHIPGGCEFEKFWGFVWELQTAVLFANQLGLSTEWLNSGPDFRVVSGSDILYVECTTYRKSFGLEEFIGELFQRISPEIVVTHVPLMQFFLPKNNDIVTFLDELFRPYVDPSFIAGKMAAVQKESPILLPTPVGARNFYVYLENQDAPSHNVDLEMTLHISGDPEYFLRTALNEVLGNKALANDLSHNHPNLLMINFLLGQDWQLAKALRSLEEPKLAEAIDGVLLTACGIDEIPTLQNASLYLLDGGHPMQYYRKGSQSN